MPLISPTEFNIEEISDALSSPDLGLIQDRDDDDIRQIFDNENASKHNAARIIAELMHSGGTKSGHIQLKAAEIVLDIHGVRDKDGKANRAPIVNFIVRSEQVNINQIFNPQR